MNEEKPRYTTGPGTTQPVNVPPRKREEFGALPVQAFQALARVATLQPTPPPPPRAHTTKSREYFSNINVLKTSGPPSEPPSLTAEGLTFYRGVYLVCGPTGSGKSVATSAIVHCLNRNKQSASFLYVFEPRARPIRNARHSMGVEDEFFFAKPPQFVNDLKEVLGRTRKADSPLGLLAADSITTPLKAVDSRAYRGQATFAGGQQPSDRDFLIQLSQVCNLYNLAILATLNTQLVPYVDSLEGAVEGVLEIKNPQEFTITDRGTKSARREVACRIPDIDVSAALDAWGFTGVNRSSDSTGSNRSVIGPKEIRTPQPITQNIWHIVKQAS